MVKARWTLLLLAAALAVPSTAMATHMSSYVFYPTEHDDIGRSFEPDFQSTSVLGPLVRNCIVSLNLAPGCIPDSSLPAPDPGQTAQLAPGCTDDQGRQPSGLCGMFTIGAGNGNTGTLVPAGTAGIQGKSGDAAPGRFTPNKNTQIRFLDSQLHFQNVPPAGGSTYLEYNAKMKDSGTAATLAGIDPNFGGDAILPGGTALWAWYGYWADKNGNGVVDHLRAAQECTGTSCPPSGGVADANEFTWIGRCIQFNGQAAPPGQKYCNFEQNTLMPVWVYPGNHHAFCGFAVATVTQLCGLTPGDAPGRQLYWYAVDACPGPDCVAFLEEDDAWIYGDPIFGEQNSRAVDHNPLFGGIWGMGDRTGEPLITGRQWVYGLGWSTWFYDQSLIVGTVIVTGVTKDAPVAGLETDFDLGTLLMSDVDTYRSWNPTAENLLQNQIKPSTRSTWVFTREVIAAGDATQAAGQLIPGTRLTYDECDPYLNVPCPSPTSSSQTLGRTFDRVFDPGWSKEPNTALDVYPGAVHGVCADAFETHQGQCNTYAGYASSRQAWFDIGSANAIYTQLAWRTPIGNCVLCVTAGPSGTPDIADGLRDPNEYTRVLDPGSHVFFARGGIGGWLDRAQAHEEDQLDILATLGALTPVFRTETYMLGPDGFLGDIVNTTGFTRVGGFLPETCTARGVTAVYEYAQCHPYADGNIGFADSANTDESTGGEFKLGEKQGGQGPQGHWMLRLTPADGCWSVPVLVWRQFDTWTIGNTGDIQDFTSQCTTIVMSMGEGPGLLTRDLLILPQGSMGETIISEVSGTVTVKEGGQVILSQFVRDVDVYGSWSSP